MRTTFYCQIAPSVYIRRSVVTFCETELDLLHMYFNAKKPAFMRLGPRFNVKLCQYNYELWSGIAMSRYLWVYTLLEAEPFKCCWDNCKTGFNRDF